MQTEPITPDGQIRQIPDYRRGVMVPAPAPVACPAQLLPYAGKPVRTPRKRAPVACLAKLVAAEPAHEKGQRKQPVRPHRLEVGLRGEIALDLCGRKKLVTEFLSYLGIAAEFPLQAPAFAERSVQTPPKRAPAARPSQPHRAEISPDLQKLIAEFLPAEKLQILSFLASEFPLQAAGIAEAPTAVASREALEVFGQLNCVRQKIVLGTMRAQLEVQRGNENQGLTVLDDAALYYGATAVKE